jgi:hypothetical protein
MQAQAREMEAQRRANNLQEAPRSCSTVRTDPADPETLDAVLIMLGRRCSKPSRSESILRRVFEPH